MIDYTMIGMRIRAFIASHVRYAIGRIHPRGK